jgi:GTP-binding protein HflX
MADSKADLLAGAGGLVTEESQTHHEGRKALLLVRNNEDCSEFIALAKTMGINIVERVEQRGRDDPKWFMGQGKLQDIAEELASRTAKHPWEKVDLLLLHTNATPRQLVGVNDTVGLEVWDRVRLLLSLFTVHASSVEARTQVRIARLQSDRTVLREVVKQQTTGERAGFGGAGKTAAGSVLTNVNAELAALRKKQRKQNKLLLLV